MIDRLIVALKDELELTGNEIADVLWLAIHIRPNNQEALSDSLDSTTTSDETDNQDSDKQNSIGSDSSESEDIKQKKEEKAGVYQESQDKNHSQHKSKELAFRVPDARSLREPLSLAKALSPLMHCVNAGNLTVLDEEATTQLIAEQGVCIPILQPEQEAWLDLAIVVDESPSMVIWRHTITELERLTKNYGVFRDVRSWRLVIHDGGQAKEKVQIQPGFGSTVQSQCPRSIGELLDPKNRRLVWIVSDCVSPFWRDKAIQAELNIWAQNGPVAIVQMLPDWLWRRTALAQGTTAWFRALAPGIPNQYLIKEIQQSHRYRRQKQTNSERVAFNIPVITLEDEPIKAWAQMFCGQGGIRVPGIVFNIDAQARSNKTESAETSPTKLSGEERVQRFRATASPIARRLALLLAAAPVISLPVVRILQEIKLRNSKQVNVAEVFLGGLLKPLSEIQMDTNPDQVQFDFVEGVREILLESVPQSDRVDILAIVSQYVADRMGLSLEDFGAFLRSPAKDNTEQTSQLTPFALISAQILEKLGPEGANFAKELRQGYVKSTHLQESQGLNHAEHRIRILLLDSDQSWCEPVSIYISQRLENLGFPCQVIVAHDRNHALREVESQAPHLVIASEQLRQYETIRDIEGLLFLEKIDQLCPASLKVLILDRQPDDDQELRNLIDRFFISRTFLRANAALDMLGFVDAVIQLLTTKDFFKDGYALLVGVGEDLPVTVKDAQALYEVLSNPSLAAYPRNNIQLLTEQNANRANILDALDKLALKAQSNPEATISIYFSGHGVYLQETGDYFLVPYGCNRNNYATASISSREFTDKIRAIQTQKLILLLDCCHAGGMLEKTLGEPFIKSPPTPKLISDLSFGNGRVVVASSSREQFSYTGEPYSIFTACLLDALKGRPNKDNSDKYVRIFDVLLYLLEEVPKRALPSSQNPILPIIEEPSDNFPICFRPQLMVPNDVVKDLSWERRNLGSEISSKHIEERIEERIALFDTLSRLPNHQFEQLVFSLSVPQGNQGGAAATQGARISQLLEWADSAVGCGLAQLTQVLRQVMGSQD